MASGGKRKLIDEVDDDDDDGKRKKNELGKKVPLPLMPPRDELPGPPHLDSDNYLLVHTNIKIKQVYKFSPYNLKPETIVIRDGIERYSSKFGSNKDISQTSIETKLPINLGYFPFELTSNRKLLTKKSSTRTNKNLDNIQKQEEMENAEGGKKNNEDGEPEEEPIDEEDEENDDYEQNNRVDSDDDGGDDSDGGGGDADF
eukprot:gene6715-8324_t